MTLNLAKLPYAWFATSTTSPKWQKHKTLVLKGTSDDNEVMLIFQQSFPTFCGLLAKQKNWGIFCDVATRVVIAIPTTTYYLVDEFFSIGKIKNKTSKSIPSTTTF